MKILIYGAGAIGCHLAYCLNDNNHITLLARGQHYREIKKNGLIVKIYNNKKLLKKKKLLINENLKIFDDFIKIKNIKYDVVFITVKIKDYNSILINNIKKIIKPNSAIITPCTGFSNWWFEKIFNKKNKKGFNIKNVIAMTMWLSSKIEKPGSICVKHIQRGYPMKEVNISSKNKTDFLRKNIKKHCKSPIIKNAESEIYIKTINAFAFNLVALITGFTNKELKKDADSIEKIKKTMNEFDLIIKSLGIKIYQSIDSRVEQTLMSNEHTMSMLNDLNNRRKIEIKYLWKNLEIFLKLSNRKAPFTNSLYNLLLKKIKNKNVL